MSRKHTFIAHKANTRIRHNLSNTDTYRIYMGMIERCYNPNCNTFYKYGKKGIDVSPDWRESFLNFYRDMGERPGKSFSLDRINSSLGYSKENCRWANTREQARNKITNVFLEFDGRRMIAADWAEELKISELGISARLITRRRSRGWSDVRCLTTPVKKRNLLVK